MSTEHVFMGVDPGATGAAVTVGMWQCEIQFSKLTDLEIWKAIRAVELACRQPGVELTAILEKISVRPPTSASRGGVMMAQYGLCRGLLIAAGIRTIEVTPSAWTRKMGRTDPKKTTYTKKKQRNQELAETLYPKRKIIRETCDAFLLAEYGRRFHQ